MQGIYALYREFTAVILQKSHNLNDNAVKIRLIKIEPYTVHTDDTSREVMVSRGIVVFAINA